MSHETHHYLIREQDKKPPESSMLTITLEAENPDGTKRYRGFLDRPDLI